MANSTTGTLSQNLHTYYSKVFLETAEKNLVVMQCGDDRVHPKGTGKISKYLRYGNLNPTSTPLTEAVTPAENQIATNQYQVEIKQYGDYIKISDFLQTTSISPEVKKHTERMAEGAARNMDSIIISHLEANASEIYWPDVAYTSDNDVTASDTLTTKSVLRGISKLRGADASPYADGMFKWVVHPHVAVDMMSDTATGGFVDVNKYTDGNVRKILNGEVGRAYGARILESTNVTLVPNATPVDVYRSFLFARDSFVTTKFNRDAMELIIKPLGSAGSADPLNQRSSVGYKLEFGVLYTGGDFTDANGASPETCIQIRGAATN